MAPIVKDVCGNNIVPVITENRDPICKGDKIYTFSYTDCTGNTSVYKYTYTITNCAVDIEVTKNASVEEALVNDGISFTLTATNNGPREATNVVLEDVIPNGYRYIISTVDIGTINYDTTTKIVTWSIPRLTQGQVAKSVISVRVLNVDDYENRISLVSVDQIDINSANDEESDTISVLLSTSCITIYNEFSPNGDGINDFFKIDCIENYPSNKLSIFNRWGSTVYSAEGYDNNLKKFTGMSTGSSTLLKDNLLPVGTYYLMLDLTGEGIDVIKSWIYIQK